MVNRDTFTTPSVARLRKALVGLAAVLLVAACSDDSDNNNGGVTEPPIEPPIEEPQPFAELYDQGITRYLGEYTPMLSETEGNIVSHTFGTGDGPLCLDGSEYRMSTRDAGSEDLVIYLQGGGACWSEFCAATPSADPTIGAVGFLDPDREDNPVKDWNLVYLPYCDGGLHASDRDTDTDGDGADDRFQRGLHNLSAALDVAVNTFPSPRRILLSGSSAGGLGTTFALPLVRYVYPDVKIEVINDSGVGVNRPDQPEFMELLVEDWNTGAFLPASCDNCIPEDGHFTEYHIWQMDQDPTIRRGMLSFNRDSTFADFFLGIGKDAFEEALYEEMAQIEEAHPDRSKTWIPAGEDHTFLQARPDQTAGGVPLLDWIGFMLDGSDEWVSVQD